MIGIESLLLFVPIALLLIATPGPDFLLISTTTLAKGSRAGIAACFGVCAGVICHAVLAGVGVSEVLVKHPILFDTVRFLGAAYLLYLSFRSFFKSKKSEASSRPDPGLTSKRSFFGAGFLTNLLNPKVLVFTSLLVIQFVDLGKGNVFLQFVQLGAVYSVLTLLCYAGLVFLASKIKSRVTPSRKFRNYADKLLGALFVGFALRLILLERP